MKRSNTLSIVAISLLSILFCITPCYANSGSRAVDQDLEVSRGNVNGRQTIKVFGRNGDIDTGGFEDVWTGGGTYTYSTVPEVMFISSSDVGDTQNYLVTGLDANFNETNATVTATGQTEVEIGGGSETWIRVFSVQNVGSVDTIGTVYVARNTGGWTAGVPNDPTDIRAQIEASDNQSEMAIYTVPANKKGFLKFCWTSYANKQAAVSTVKIFVRASGEVFVLKWTVTLNSVGSGYIPAPIIPPLRILGKTDVKMVADSDTNNTSLSGGFSLIVIDD